MDREDQLSFMERLKNQYLDNMEGEDAEGFAKWEALMCAASLILEAMKEDLE